MATPLTAITEWEGARRTLALADTAYSVTLPTASRQVSIFVEGTTDARYRNTDGNMGATDNWYPVQAGGTSVFTLDLVNNTNPPVIYLATGGTNVVVRVLPESSRGV